MLFAMPSIEKLCKTLGTGYAKFLRPAEAGAKRWEGCAKILRPAEAGAKRWEGYAKFLRPAEAGA
jgi:hypothetical protein